MPVIDDGGRPGSRPGCEVHFNPSPQTKVSAINANIPDRHFGLLVLCSDDMIPQMDGYDDRIVELFKRHFPQGDGLLHANDGRNGRVLNTLPIMDYAYFSRFGYIYNPQYIGLWCDNEQQEVAERLGRTAYVDEVVIRHEWTNATGRDPLHLKNEVSYEADMETFRQRRALGFPIHG